VDATQRSSRGRNPAHGFNGLQYAVGADDSLKQFWNLATAKVIQHV